MDPPVALAVTLHAVTPDRRRGDRQLGHSATGAVNTSNRPPRASGADTELREDPASGGQVREHGLHHRDQAVRIRSCASISRLMLTSRIAENDGSPGAGETSVSSSTPSASRSHHRSSTRKVPATSLRVHCVAIQTSVLVVHQHRQQQG